MAEGLDVSLRQRVDTLSEVRIGSTVDLPGVNPLCSWRRFA